MVKSPSTEIVAPAKEESKAHKKMPGRRRQQQQQQQHEQQQEKLTPYQGKSRAFGHFYCEDCSKEWASANSWANCYQMCKDCGAHVYPYKQLRLQPGKNAKNMRKPHPMDLCQRCIETGTRCWETEWRFIKGFGKKS